MEFKKKLEGQLMAGTANGHLFLAGGLFQQVLGYRPLRTGDSHGCGLFVFGDSGVPEDMGWECRVLDDDRRFMELGDVVAEDGYLLRFQREQAMAPTMNAI